jgi:H+-transporting ATPase
MYEGLTTAQVKELLQKYGPNAIPEKKDTFFQKVLHKLISPISFMLLAAALLSLFVHKVFDSYFILFLLLLNIIIALWQEGKADNAIKKLNENLAQKVKVRRDGKWVQIDSTELVPGDLIQLASGDVIPADGKLVKGQHVSVNESALTGESLPKDKKNYEPVFSGSFLAAGIADILITATGKDTNFGKTIFSVERIRKQSLLEKDVLDISKYLTFFSLLAILLLSIVFLMQHVSILELLTLDLSLLIAGVPISLPTVMTLIIEFGVLALAKKNAIVRRLSALEDLANVNLLLTDKTGTLTKNQITVQDIYAYNAYTHNDVVFYASLAVADNDHDLIDIAINTKAKELHLSTEKYSVVDFIPADSNRKRSTATLRHFGKEFVVSLGAPQIVFSKCESTKAMKEKFIREVQSLAENGYRSLAVAVSHHRVEEKNMKLIGLLALSDTLRVDAKNVIQFMNKNNIHVAMVTGDNKAIAAHVSKQLALADGQVMPKDELEKVEWKKIKSDFYYSVGAFAEILPEDKLHLVEEGKRFFTVASNGDGVNDLPAIKAANVGIAVKNAVTALKATADIVLLSDGISVIKDAIIESRKIFERLYTYSLYRISESLRLIITITVLGIWYRVYPLTALQIIILALLNDIPIISLATDRVKITNRPSKINARQRFTLSSLYGLVGIAESLILFVIVRNILHMNWLAIQTIYFLKLTVSGHMLIYVAHTKEHWFKFLPSKEVIIATSVTQLIATLLAFSGFLMPTGISIRSIVFVWLWALLWMQIASIVKITYQHVTKE